MTNTNEKANKIIKKNMLTNKSSLYVQLVLVLLCS